MYLLIVAICGTNLEPCVMVAVDYILVYFLLGVKVLVLIFSPHLVVEDIHNEFHHLL